MNLNDVPFITSASNRVHYGTSNDVHNITYLVLEAGLISIIKSYTIRGFSAGAVFLDMQFKCVKDGNHMGVSAVIFRKGEHVKRIELFHLVI